jgi:hypothetical protein
MEISRKGVKKKIIPDCEPTSAAGELQKEVKCGFSPRIR